CSRNRRRARRSATRRVRPAWRRSSHGASGSLPAFLAYRLGDRGSTDTARILGGAFALVARTSRPSALVPDPFWGGAGFSLIVFGILFLWPSLERRFTHDYGFHNVLDRPRDAPWRTAIGAALLTWVFVVFVAGAADRIYVTFGVSYESLVWVFRVLA